MVEIEVTEDIDQIMAFLKDTDPQNSITKKELISKKENPNRKRLKKKSSHSDVKQVQEAPKTTPLLTHEYAASEIANAMKQYSSSKPSKDLENCKKLEYSIVYVCEICQKDFAGPATLKIHERVHRKEKDDRIEESETKIATKIFVQTIDPQDIVDQCDEIDIKEEKLSPSYKSDQDLDVIDKKVNTIKPLNTKKHLKRKKNVNVESSAKRNLKNCDLLYEEEEENDELDCDNSYDRQNKLKTQIKTVHEGIKPHQCSICESRFKSKQGMTNHISTVHEGKKPYKCSSCDKSYSQLCNLKTHITTVHEGKGSLFVCSLCESSFPRKGDLKRHLEHVHEGKKPHKCSLCESAFSQKSTLKIHINTVHEKIKQFSCPVELCDYTSGNKGNFKLHVEKHGGIAQYSCPLCDKDFFTQLLQKRHIESVHEKKKPFKCSICEYSSSSKFNLKKHTESVHEGKQPHKCSLCDKSFSEKGNLKKHIKWHKNGT